MAERHEWCGWSIHRMRLIDRDNIFRAEFGDHSLVMGVGCVNN
jgi:hypothetical protein